VYERIGGFKVTRGRLPGGDAGTTTTVGLMRRLALEGSRDVEVREAALEALRTAGVRSHDNQSALAALFHFVRDQVMFVGDVAGVETLQSPRYTLHVMAGDCDDRATLLAALVLSIGLTGPSGIKFRVVGADPRNPQRFSHVYLVVRMGGRDVPLDPTYSDNRLGWQLPNPSRLADFGL
jgi:transglutaminase-like putative cysteine protease